MGGIIPPARWKDIAKQSFEAAVDDYVKYWDPRGDVLVSAKMDNLREENFLKV